MLPITNSGGTASDPIAITSEDESSTHPRWSPDGKFITFLSARKDGKQQVWLLNRLGGEAEKLTDTAQDVEDFLWSPDGRRVALILRDPSPEELEGRRLRRKSQEEKSRQTLGHRPLTVQGRHPRLPGPPPHAHLRLRPRQKISNPNHQRRFRRRRSRLVPGRQTDRFHQQPLRP